MRTGPAVALDAVLVLVFVLIGRRTHENPLDVGGIATTFWPFVAGLAMGWLVSLARRWPPAAVTTGITVWLATVVAGMLLRAASGQGTAVSFVAVATLVLGAFLVGWRMLGTRRHAPGARNPR